MNIQHYTPLSVCLLVFLLLLCAWPATATSAEIMVFAPGGVRSALLGAAKAFERETDNKVNFTFGTGGGIHKQVGSVIRFSDRFIRSRRSADFDLNKKRTAGSIG